MYILQKVCTFLCLQRICLDIFLQNYISFLCNLRTSALFIRNRLSIRSSIVNLIYITLNIIFKSFMCQRTELNAAIPEAILLVSIIFVALACLNKDWEFSVGTPYYYFYIYL